MEPVKFPGQNVVYAKDQPEYRPLPAMKFPDGMVITCWEMTEEELEHVMLTRQVYLCQMTFNQALQPVMVGKDLSDFLT